MVHDTWKYWEGAVLLADMVVSIAGNETICTIAFPDVVLHSSLWDGPEIFSGSRTYINMAFARNVMLDTCDFVMVTPTSSWLFYSVQVPVV